MSQKNRTRRQANAAAQSSPSKVRISLRTGIVVIAGFLALGAAAALIVRWMNQPEVEGPKDMAPAVAAVPHHPLLAEAMEAVEKDVSTKKPGDWLKLASKHRIVFDDSEVQWLVIHQLKGFGNTPERMAYAMRGIGFDAKGRPEVRRRWEGHPGQLAIALHRAGVALDEPLEAQGRQFTLRDLIRANMQRYDVQTLGRDDPAYLIEGASMLVRPSENWETDSGRPNSIMRLVTVGFRRLPDRAEPGTFACGGLHYGYAVGVAKKQAELRNDLTAEDREHMKTLGLLTAKMQETWFEDVLPQYVTLARRCVSDFKRTGKEIHALEIRSSFTGLGHILELALDPRSDFYGKLPEKMVKESIEALAGLTTEWFKPENEQLRLDVGKFKLGAAGDLPMAQIIQGDLCHSYRAMLLWSKDRQQNP